MSGNKMFNYDLYGETAISQAYRILSLGCRESTSSNYGCFERYYWHYQQIDFVNARFQEAALFLALLFSYKHPKNRFFKKEKIKDWTKAAINYWQKIQHKDGSFDEYWPNERSFIATAFSTYAVVEACRLLALTLPQREIEAACRWLSAHENMDVLNQMAAAASALLISGIVLDDDRIKKWAFAKMDVLLSNQNPEGYFKEYGGYDIGYLTITLSYLGKFFAETREVRVKEAALKACQYLKDKIRQDGTYDYRKTSRKTQYIYPFGLQVFRQKDLLSRHLFGLKNDLVVNPKWMDDRFCLPLSIDYLQTAMEEKKGENDYVKTPHA